jgi:alpha-aminoadipic semialdehyde synthase
MTWLVHGIYWEAKYPRVLTREGLKNAMSNGSNRLMGLTDISADYEGSIDFTSRFTDIEEPFLLYNPFKGEFKEKISDMETNDILFHSVDHLPAEMPKEASNHFGDKLFPFIERVVKSDFNKPFAEQTDIPDEIRGACITVGGALTPDYEYI